MFTVTHIPLSLWARIRMRVFPLTVLLELPTELIKFHYTSGSTTLDVIRVYVNDKMVYAYYWVCGEEAYPNSKLGKLHAIFKGKRYPTDRQTT